MKLFTGIFIFITGIVCGSANAQGDSMYMESVKKQVTYIDSVISEYSINPVTGFSKKNTHFSDLTKGEVCGSAELYSDSTGNLRLSYSNNCDSAALLQDYYFIQNKIVFIRTVNFSLPPGTYLDQYYLNDSIVNNAADKLYISEGYRVLKRIHE